jgi:hypothetical protein
MVATRMPKMMGRGFLKRAANKKANSWVLSPISARATAPVERRRASMDSAKSRGVRFYWGRGKRFSIDKPRVMFGLAQRSATLRVETLISTRLNS